jgi:lysozyme family protein
MSFATAYLYTKEFEGGYANALKDKGGETFRGISRVSFPHWPGWRVVDEAKAALEIAKGQINWRVKKNWKLIDQKLKGNTALDQMVTDFYRDSIYKPTAKLGLDEFVTDKLFDMRVNLGSADRIFQMAINKLSKDKIALDGRLGPKSLAAAKALDPVALVQAMALEQEAFYLRNTIPDWPEAEQSFRERARWIPPRG